MFMKTEFYNHKNIRSDIKKIVSVIKYIESSKALRYIFDTKIGCKVLMFFINKWYSYCWEHRWLNN